MANIGARPGREPHPALTALLQRIYKETDEDAAENVADEIIAHYDEETMFEELAHGLAERDVHEELDHAATPPSDARLKTRGKLERQRTDNYFREFDEHGLGHVVVDASRDIPCED